MIKFPIIFILAYLLGSINTSIIVGKIKSGDDIRNHGSGNAVCGKNVVRGGANLFSGTSNFARIFLAFCVLGACEFQKTGRLKGEKPCNKR